MPENELLDFEQRLHGVALPTVNTSLHKSLLRTALLAELQRTAKPRRGETFALLWGLLTARRFRSLRLALPATLLLVAAIIWQGLLTPPTTLAYATLHANPAVQLTVNTRGRVTKLTPLSPEASILFIPEDFRHIQAELALSQIVSRLHAEGFLRPDADLAFLLQAAPAMPEKRVSQLADTLHKALENSLQAAGTGTNLRRHTVSQQVYAGSRAAGLLPLDFVDLLETELEDEDLISLFHLKEQLPLDEPSFRARFAAMSKKVARELRADMKREAALELGLKLMDEELDEDESDAEEDDNTQGRDRPSDVRPNGTPRRDKTEREDAPQEDDDTSSRGQGQGEDGRKDERDRDAADRDDTDDADKDEDGEREPAGKPPETERDGADDMENGEDDESPRGRGQGGE